MAKKTVIDPKRSIPELKMAKKTVKSASRGKVFYTLRPRKEGRSAFSDVKLPDGTIIRRVDESVHRKALSNAARAYREKA